MLEPSINDSYRPYVFLPTNHFEYLRIHSVRIKRFGN